VVIAYAKIGLTLWAQSCPVKTVDGSCVEVKRERAVSSKGRGKRKRSSQQTQCGPESKTKVTVVARKSKEMADAIAAFSKAVTEYERRAGKMDGDERGAQYYYALAKFHLAEKDYEQYLQLKFPENLNFDPKNEALKKKSEKRFNDWYAAKEKDSKELGAKYFAVIGTKDAANAIAAAARIGQVAQNASDALFTAEIPANLRPYEEAVELYCDTLMERTEALEDLTVNAFTTCLDKSTSFGWFSEWSRLCERELGQIKPDQFPTAAELHEAPNRSAVITDVEPAISTLE
jgi:hypothetical protein